MRRIIIILSSLLFVLPSCTSKENVYSKIQNIALKQYVGESETSAQDIYASDFVISRYVGRKDNIFAVVVERDYFIHPFNDLVQIEIEDYVSETYYYRDHLPVIYTNNNLYSLNDALNDALIDLEFIKTFDVFQLKHNPEELYEIFID